MAYNIAKNAPRDQLSDGPIGSYDGSKDAYASLDVAFDQLDPCRETNIPTISTQSETRMNENIDNLLQKHYKKVKSQSSGFSEKFDQQTNIPYGNIPGVPSPYPLVPPSQQSSISLWTFVKFILLVFVVCLFIYGIYLLSKDDSGSDVVKKTKMSVEMKYNKPTTSF